MLDRHVQSAELYYHEQYYKSLFINTVLTKSQTVHYAEAASLEAVRSYAFSSSDQTFQVSYLESVCIEKLKDFGVERTSHTTHFVNIVS